MPHVGRTLRYTTPSIDYDYYAISKSKVIQPE
jgi:hypothetical protein